MKPKQTVRTTKKDIGVLIPVYEWSETDPVPRAPTSSYLRSHLDREDESESSNYLREEVERRGLVETRRDLLVDGITYSEWLELKKLENVALAND